MRTLPFPSLRLRVALALLATAITLVATLGSADGSALVVPDWALHAVGFGLLAMCYALALDGRSPALVLGGAFAMALGVGILVELVQPLVGRTASLRDALADGAGAAFAVLLYRAGHRLVRWAPERTRRE